MAEHEGQTDAVREEGGPRCECCGEAYDGGGRMYEDAWVCAFCAEGADAEMEIP